MPNPLRTLFADLVPRFMGAIGPSAPEVIELDLPIDLPLPTLVESDRFFTLDRRESYFRKLQHAHKPYDWNGNMSGYDGEAPLPVGYVAPYSKRQPSARYALGSIIVRRFTAMLFGQGCFPSIEVDGDEEAEAFANELVKQSKLHIRLNEARNIGGATGTACLSWGLAEGKPKVQVHNSKHCVVLEWEDEEERIPARVLKSYSYQRDVYDPKAERVIKLKFFYARYWDAENDITWEPIPEKAAKLPNWHKGPIKEHIRHGFGFVPFYWVQNEPDSVDPDGVGDYEGLECNLDEIDEIMSAGSSGTKANVDPTLVVHMNPTLAPKHPVRKGSQQAIFSEQGAEYLELKGQATKAAIDMLEEIRRRTLDAADCIVPEPEKMTGSGQAQSGKAMEMMYQPMTARADVFRGQYGGHAIIPIVRDMLRVARKFGEVGPVEVEVEGEKKVSPATGFVMPKRKIQKPTPPRPAPEMGERVMEEPPEPPEAEYELVDHSPGTSEALELKWPAYFPPSAPDQQASVTALQAANGGKPVLSVKTSVKLAAATFGIEDVEAEVHEIEMDGEKAMDAEARKMAMMPPPPEPAGGPPPKE